jgi:hypothetical protein
VVNFMHFAANILFELQHIIEHVIDDTPPEKIQLGHIRRNALEIKLIFAALERVHQLLVDAEQQRLHRVIDVESLAVTHRVLARMFTRIARNKEIQQAQRSVRVVEETFDALPLLWILLEILNKTQLLEIHSKQRLSTVVE